MRAGRMVQVYLLTAEVEDQLAVVTDGRRRGERVERRRLFLRAEACEDPLSHVLLRVDRRQPREDRVAAGMISVMVRVDHVADRPIGHLADLIQHRLSKLYGLPPRTCV
jgi:hypothetical protein